MAYSYKIHCDSDTLNPLRGYDVVSSDILGIRYYSWGQK